MNEKYASNYYKIGIFVIIGIVLMIVAILVLGAGGLFQRSIIAETYFNESVQGLSIGSPVKYKGMTVGEVKKIALVSSVYPQDGNGMSGHYIYVEMAFMGDYFANQSKSEIMELLARDIKKGLRIKLALQGLTGNAYLELNFENPKTNLPLPITWTPENFYVPSTASTLSRFSDNAGYLLEELKKVNIDKLFHDFNVLINNTTTTMTRFDDLIASTKNQLVVTSNNLEGISENLRQVSEDAKAYPARLLFGEPPKKLDPKKL